MLKRLLSASVLGLAVAVSTCSGAFAAGGALTTATTAPQTTLPPSSPPLYCPPPVTSVVCGVLPTPVPCKGCSAPATSNQQATAAATPALYCAPTLQDLQCIVDEVTHPCQMRCAATTGTTAAPTFACAIPLLCQVLGLLCPNCTLNATTTATPAARVDSVPGDPCSRDWGEPVETICHL